jgi:hypothetical protein
MEQQKLKKIADKIFKDAAPLKTTVILQLDDRSFKSLEKVFATIDGFSDMPSKKIQIEIPVAINSDVTNVYDFETNLMRLFKKPLNNVRFNIIRTGRQTRPVKPLR